MSAYYAYAWISLIVCGIFRVTKFDARNIDDRIMFGISNSRSPMDLKKKRLKCLKVGKIEYILQKVFFRSRYKSTNIFLVLSCDQVN